jgi:transcription factor CON7
MGPLSLYNHMPTPPTASADDLVSPGVPTNTAGRTSAIEAPGRGSHMEQRGSTAADYAHTGLPSPYSATYGETRSAEGSPADQQPAPAPFPSHHEVRPNNYATSATAAPASDYNAYPTSARSGTFPDHLQRQYHPHPAANNAGMAQQPNSPSMPQQDGRNHHSPQLTTDRHLQIDPSIATASPQYAAYGQAHSPYSTGEMTPSYYQQRPDWSGYAAQHSAGPMTPSSHVFPQGPSSAPPQARPNQVSRLPGFVGDAVDGRRGLT